jgi:hypothetical protein
MPEERGPIAAGTFVASAEGTMPLNACELEIDLFCRGLRLAPDVSLDGVRGIARTRAGLGSGLEMILPVGSWMKREVWVNVPVEERFAPSSPYVLRGSPRTGHTLHDERDGTQYQVRLPEEPHWYTQPTSRGVPMQRIGTLQGTCLGIYVNAVCTFWNYVPALNCRFCTTGQNVGTAEAAHKEVEDVVETCLAARRESATTFVHLNGGFQGSRGIAFTAPYLNAIKARVGMLVGVQLAPERDFSQYDRLIDLGVDHLSFCVELHDPEWFHRVCPGKDRMLGQGLFFEAMEYCARRLPRGAVSGEIIAGIEPIEHTIAAIDRITALGAFPTVCIFRPTLGSDMEDWPSPPYEDMLAVMRHVYTACRRHWIPVGTAPNLEVSLVASPDDTALLADHTPAFYAYEAFRRSVRLLARPVFAKRQRRRQPRGWHLPNHSV